MDIYYRHSDEYAKQLAACGVKHLFFSASEIYNKKLKIGVLLDTYFPYPMEEVVVQNERAFMEHPDSLSYGNFSYLEPPEVLDRILKLNAKELKRSKFRPRKLFLHQLPKGPENTLEARRFVQYVVSRAHSVGVPVVAITGASMSLAMDNFLDGAIIAPNIEADRGRVHLLNGAIFRTADSKDKEFLEHQIKLAKKFLREVGFAPEDMIGTTKEHRDLRLLASIKAWEYAKENWHDTRHLRVRRGKVPKGAPSEEERLNKLPMKLPQGQVSEEGMVFDEETGEIVSTKKETNVERKQRLKEEQAQRRKEILKARAEGVLCDYCAVFMTCEQARPGHVCAKPNGFSALASKFNTTNAMQILDGLRGLMVIHAERVSAEVEVERQEGFLSKNTSEDIMRLFSMGKDLAKMLDPKLGAADAGKGATVNIYNNTKIQAAQILQQLGSNITPQDIVSAIEQLESSTREALPASNEVIDAETATEEEAAEWKEKG